MIRLLSPGVGNGSRVGDCTIISDGANHLVIDGYCGSDADRVIQYLKKRNIKKPYLFISHAHYDHYDGIRRIIRDGWFAPKTLYCYKPSSINANFTPTVRSEQKTLQSIINEATQKGIPVRYMDHGTYRFGEIKLKVFRQQPKTAGNSDAYLNNGSLCFWFPELSYFTSGDGPENIGDLCKAKGVRPKFFKIPHHGNNCSEHNAQWLRTNGARYCWDNDPSKTITQFLAYGRRRCQQTQIKWFSNNEDINAIYQNGRCSIYKDGGVYKYECTYKGKAALKNPDALVCRYVLRGTYGKGNSRTTALIDAGWYPVATQNKVNKVTALARRIKDGVVDYGKGSARIAKIDEELGKGFGQLVQDYINVLCGKRDRA